ncbi:MAG: lipocalin family protein [Limisphaerales bacterium]
MKAPLFMMFAWAMTCSSLVAATPMVVDAKPKDGVFVTNTGYMMTVLELKDGKFRYWFKSDARSLSEPKYPLSGDYTVSGNRITLKHEQISQKQWTVRKVDGFLTLWRPDAIKMQDSPKGYLNKYSFGIRNFQRCGTGSILVLSDRPAEVAWEKPRYVEVSEERR